ncbi:MAG: OmpA family protein [Pseudomonadota bacterium]
MRTGATLAAAVIAACADTPPEYNPIEWVRGAGHQVSELFGAAPRGPRPTQVEPPPAEGRPYPNLATVPPPPTATPRAEREALIARLSADLASAREELGPPPRPATPALAAPGRESQAGPAGPAGPAVSVHVATLTFAYNSAALAEGDLKVLAEIASLALTGNARVRVVGHASRDAGPGDAVRRRAANLRIAAERAQAVGRELGRLGLPEGRLGLAAAGDTDALPAEPPWAPANRRVEIFVDY